MYKKLIAACMALAALAAFAAMPAISSAAELGETTTGGVFSKIEPPKPIRAHNVGVAKMFLSTGGVVECSNDSLTGTLTKNNGTEVEGTVETASYKGTESEERCVSPLGATKVTTNVGNGTPWCVKALPGEAMEVQVRGNSCANKARSLTFVFDVAGLECKYERTTATGPVKGTFTTDTAPENSDAIIHIPRSATGSKFVGEKENSFFCPASGELEQSFTLETDATPETEPLYFH